MGAGVGTVHGFVSSKDDGVDESHWGSKPRGLLLTTCRFHTAAIVDLVTCQDHSFFVSADAAGTCAVWLSGNLNKWVAVRVLEGRVYVRVCVCRVLGCWVCV
jgi:hypothetical protein